MLYKQKYVRILLEILDFIEGGVFMLTEVVPISSLILDPSNARKHDKKNLEAIKGSLARFGQQKPIVVGSDNVVIAGNGTLEAARELGWTEIRIVRSELTGTDRTAFSVADNRTSELSSWDDDVLSETLRSLQEEFDLTEIGFDEKDLELLTSRDKFNCGQYEDSLKQDGEEGNSSFALRVLLNDEASQQELFIELRDRGYKVKV